VAGAHTAYVSYSGFEPWAEGRGPSAPKNVHVDIRAKRGAPLWPMLGAFAFGLVFLMSKFGRFAHSSKRANLSDWVDEEDDD